MTESEREKFEAAVIDRLKESGFSEVEIRVEGLVRCDDGYQDEVINGGWHYWNAAIATHPTPPPQHIVRGIYVASKTKHAERWRSLRAAGMPILSTWIDEAGAGESGDLSDLWRRCILEASTASALVLYREPDDVLKGGWVELGAALAAGVPVLAVGIEEFTVAKDKRIRHFATVEHAMSYALGLVEDRARAALSSPMGADESAVASKQLLRSLITEMEKAKSTVDSIVGVPAGYIAQSSAWIIPDAIKGTATVIMRERSEDFPVPVFIGEPPSPVETAEGRDG